MFKYLESPLFFKVGGGPAEAFFGGASLETFSGEAQLKKTPCIWKIPWIWNGIQEQQGRQCANLCFSVPVLLCVTWSIFMSLSVSAPVNMKWYSRAAGAPMCQLRSLQDRSGCRIARTPGRKPNTCRRDKFWFWDLKEQEFFVYAFTNFVSFQNMLSF